MKSPLFDNFVEQNEKAPNVLNNCLAGEFTKSFWELVVDPLLCSIQYLGTVMVLSMLSNIRQSSA